MKLEDGIKLFKNALEDGRKIIFFGVYKKDVNPNKLKLYEIIYSYDKSTDDYTILSNTCIPGTQKIVAKSRKDAVKEADDDIAAELHRNYKILADDYNKTAMDYKSIIGEAFDFIPTLFFASQFSSNIMDEFIEIEGEEEKLLREELNEIKAIERQLIDEYPLEIKSANPKDDETSDEIQELAIGFVAFIFWSIGSERLSRIECDILTKNILDEELKISMMISSEMMQGVYLTVGGTSFLRDNRDGDSATSSAMSIVPPKWEYGYNKKSITDMVSEIVYKTMNFIFKLTSKKLDVSARLYTYGAVNKDFIPFGDDLELKDNLKGGEF